MPWEEKASPSLRPEGSREPASTRTLAAFQAATRCHPSTQGIGLRPRPWAPFSRPVGPDVGQMRRPIIPGKRLLLLDVLRDAYRRRTLDRGLLGLFLQVAGCQAPLLYTPEGSHGDIMRPNPASS